MTIIQYFPFQLTGCYQLHNEYETPRELRTILNQYIKKPTIPIGLILHWMMLAQ